MNFKCKMFTLINLSFNFIKIYLLILFFVPIQTYTFNITKNLSVNQTQLKRIIRQDDGKIWSFFY